MKRLMIVLIVAVLMPAYSPAQPKPEPKPASIANKASRMEVNIPRPVEAPPGQPIGDFGFDFDWD
jgi:hypothetical protein